MFQKAARQKIRFDSPKGQLTAEDLFDLPLTSTVGKANLDDIAKSLFKQLKSGDDMSFVTPAQKTDGTVQLKFDIVKHVIDLRVVERDENAASADRANKKQKILALIADKQDGELGAKSIDELLAMANTL
jgi:alpha-D-ribose 1-methylphosphonate 5-triphosphate synthase subunit PhnL